MKLRNWVSRAPSPPVAPDTDPADDLQRGQAAVTQSATSQGRLQRTLAILVIGGLGAGLLAWYYTSAYSKVEAARNAPKRTVAKADTDSALPPIELPTTPPTPISASPAPAPSAYRIGSVLGDFESADTNPEAQGTQPACCTPQHSNANTKSPQQLAAERLLAGPVFTRASAAEPSPASDDAEDATAPTQIATEKEAAPASELSTLLQSTPPKLARATVLPTQRLLLPKGAFVDCTLETALDSTLPGLATCLTAVDTFSADGSVVLLERGTKLIGETRGEVAHGASRLFVLWTEARTPRGIIVPLASPGTDELGRSGLPGKVNRHFMERFGAAILISVIDGAIQAAVANQTAPGSTVVNTGTTQDILTEVLRSTINIPPTVTKQQGDRIQILVARDLDFRSVYTLASSHR